MNSDFKFISIIGTIFILGIGGLLFFNTPLKIESEIVTELYSLMGDNDFKCGGLENYNMTNYRYSKLSEEYKVCNVYTNDLVDKSDVIVLDQKGKKEYCKIDDIIFGFDTNEVFCTISRVSIEEVGEVYKRIYNFELTEYIDFEIDYATSCFYNNVDEHYYCGRNKEILIEVEPSMVVYRSIKNAIKKSDSIIIRDYYLYVRNNYCALDLNYEQRNYDCSALFLENENLEVDYSLMKKYGAIYEHVFKYNSDTDTYYWYTTDVYKN